MIDREYGQTRLVCDNCDEWQKNTYDRDEFMKMLADAKDDGWSIRSDNGEWTHLCQNCHGAAAEFAE